MSSAAVRAAFVGRQELLWWWALMLDARSTLRKRILECSAFLQRTEDPARFRVNPRTFLVDANVNGTAGPSQVLGATEIGPFSGVRKFSGLNQFLLAVAKLCHGPVHCKREQGPASGFFGNTTRIGGHMYVGTCPGMYMLEQGAAPHEHLIRSMQQREEKSGYYVGHQSLEDWKMSLKHLWRCGGPGWNAEMAGHEFQHRMPARQSFVIGQIGALKPVICQSNVKEGHQNCKTMIDDRTIRTGLGNIRCAVRLSETKRSLHTMPATCNASEPLFILGSQSNKEEQAGQGADQATPAAAPDNAAGYCLMSSIYADGDKWDEVRNIQEMRRSARAWKKPGRAFMELNNQIHEFVVGDRTHRQSENIQDEVRRYRKSMQARGYVPNVELVLDYPTRF